jgi:hypothetical protein
VLCSVLLPAQPANAVGFFHGVAWSWLCHNGNHENWAYCDGYFYADTGWACCLENDYYDWGEIGDWERTDEGGGPQEYGDTISMMSWGYWEDPIRDWWCNHACYFECWNEDYNTGWYYFVCGDKNFEEYQPPDYYDISGDGERAGPAK